jgi:hypothetical protein
VPVGRRFTSTAANALLDARLREMFGVDGVTTGLERAAHVALKARSLLVRWLPPRQKPTYEGTLDPHGYTITDVGMP